MPFAEPSTAASKSASGNTMFGDLPPSSSVTRFSVSAPLRMMSLPTSREPVKQTLSTPGCATSGAPAVSPNPVSTWNTPVGQPGLLEDLRRSPDRSAASAPAGLRMKQHPAASAAATFCDAIIIG